LLLFQTTLERNFLAMQKFGIGQLYEPTMEESELQEIISPYEWFDSDEEVAFH
jgi:hypothetical protein